MWGTVPPRCPACGETVAPDFVFCHRCGTPLRYGYAPAPARPWVPPGMYPQMAPPPTAIPPGVRTKRGLGITAGALVAFALPFLSVFGALFLSVGSTFLFLDRRPFKQAHQSAVKIAYGLFWLAALCYGIVFGLFLSDAYNAYLVFAPVRQLRAPAEFFIAATTFPTAMLAVALGFQVRFLLPPRLRVHVYGSVALLVVLAVAATVLAYVVVPPTLGPGQIHMSTVAGVLNDVSLARLIELPGFLWLAYLYFRAFGNVTPAASLPAPPPTAGRQA